MGSLEFFTNIQILDTNIFYQNLFGLWPPKPKFPSLIHGDLWANNIMHSDTGQEYAKLAKQPINMLFDSRKKDLDSDR